MGNGMRHFDWLAVAFVGAPFVLFHFAVWPTVLRSSRPFRLLGARSGTSWSSEGVEALAWQGEPSEGYSSYLDAAQRSQARCVGVRSDQVAPERALTGR